MQASIRNIKGIDISTEQGLYHGADQDWFSSRWRRTAGCGPTTASNILRYMNDRVSQLPPAHTKEDMQKLMDYVWDYVTPGVFGLNSTEMFSEGMDRLISERGNALRCRVLDIPADDSKRPEHRAVADFFMTCFEQDSPVAFLNLDRGQLYTLESWHWVTLISMRQEENKLYALAADNGRLLELDIGLWLASTKKKGGFVGLVST